MGAQAAQQQYNATYTDTMGGANVPPPELPGSSYDPNAPHSAAPTGTEWTPPGAVDVGPIDIGGPAAVNPEGALGGTEGWYGGGYVPRYRGYGGGIVPLPWSGGRR